MRPAEQLANAIRRNWRPAREDLETFVRRVAPAASPEQRAEALELVASELVEAQERR